MSLDRLSGKGKAQHGIERSAKFQNRCEKACEGKKIKMDQLLSLNAAVLSMKLAAFLDGQQDFNFYLI